MDKDKITQIASGGEGVIHGLSESGVVYMLVPITLGDESGLPSAIRGYCWRRVIDSPNTVEDGEI